MYRIKTLNKISPTGLALFDRNLFSVSDAITDEDGILVRSADLHSYEFGENLRAITRAGAGTNNIPVDRCSEKGIVVFNTPGANANAVKEMVITAMLLASRGIYEGIRWAEGIDPEADVDAIVEKGKNNFVGPELYGKTLGVIGLGAVGGQAANIATKLGMTVYGYDPYLSVENALNLSRSVIRVNDEKSIYDRADYISIHSPLTADTKGMLNAQAFAAMKPGVRIINMARGGLVDNVDMTEAVASGRVAKYVTDFPARELMGQKNIIAIPHLGASTPESEENCAEMAARELVDYLLYGTIRNSVNMPVVEMDRTGIVRLGIIHRNIPNMLNNILNTLSAENVNIENMMNRSKGDYAYTLLDFGSQITESTTTALKKLEGILRVRIIK